MPEGEEAAIGMAFHARLLAGDVLASHDVFDRYYRPLVRFLHGRRLVEDNDLVETAVSQALCGYLQCPERYRPERGKSLLNYLRMSAEGDLRNLRKAGARQRALVHVGLDDLERNSRAATVEDPGDDLAEAEDLRSQAAGLRAAIVETPAEAIVLDLMAEGEKRTEVFAAALGWADLPAAEQRARLEQIKDRLRKRARRLRRE